MFGEKCEKTSLKYDLYKDLIFSSKRSYILIIMLFSVDGLKHIIAKDDRVFSNLKHHRDHRSSKYLFLDNYLPYMRARSAI